MKKIVHISLFTALLTLLISSCGEQANKTKPEQFETMLTDIQSVLIDVRTPQEYAEAHLKGAINMDYYSKDFVEQIKAIDPNKTILLYCKSGNRSGQAAAVLKKHGFSKVYDLEGGISNWISSGKPTE